MCWSGRVGVLAADRLGQGRSPISSFFSMAKNGSASALSRILRSQHGLAACLGCPPKRIRPRSYESALNSSSRPDSTTPATCTSESNRSGRAPAASRERIDPGADRSAASVRLRGNRARSSSARASSLAKTSTRDEVNSHSLIHTPYTDLIPYGAGRVGGTPTRSARGWGRASRCRPAGGMFPRGAQGSLPGLHGRESTCPGAAINRVSPAPGPWSIRGRRAEVRRRGGPDPKTLRSRCPRAAVVLPSCPVRERAAVRW